MEGEEPFQFEDQDRMFRHYIPDALEMQNTNKVDLRNPEPVVRSQSHYSKALPQS